MCYHLDLRRKIYNKLSSKTSGAKIHKKQRAIKRS